MKIIMTLTQEGSQQIIEFIDENYEYFPQELEGPIAPQTYRANRSFWLKAFGIPTPYCRDCGIPTHYIKEATAVPVPSKDQNQQVSCIILTDRVAWVGPMERF